jgi:hypothetical protein
MRREDKREERREELGRQGIPKERKKRTKSSNDDKVEIEAKGECKQGYSVKGQLTCRPTVTAAFHRGSHSMD